MLKTLLGPAEKDLPSLHNLLNGSQNHIQNLTRFGRKEFAIRNKKQSIVKSMRIIFMIQ